MRRSEKTLVPAAFICLAGFGYILCAHALGATGTLIKAGGLNPSINVEVSQNNDYENGNDQNKHRRKGECEDNEDDREKEERAGHDRHGDHDRLSLTAPGVSVRNPTTLLSAVSIANTGRTSAQNVQVTSIKLRDGDLTSPTMLPLNLGTIRAGSSAVLNADFSGGPFNPGGSYLLSVQGTYSVEQQKRTDKNKRKTTRCFTSKVILVVPPGAPGSTDVKTTTLGSDVASGAPFQHQPPNFGPEVNPPGWTVPRGPFVPGTPTEVPTFIQEAPIGDRPTPAQIGISPQQAPLAGPGIVTFNENRGLGLNGSTTAEPSGATGGGVVFVTANWFAAYSTDGGSSFTQLDPTIIFPNDAVGFCCDQIVQYVPSIDRFVWLLQGNGVRIASASAADIISSGGTAWTYWNLTPNVFGQPTGTGFDYPDLSIGTNYLYMSWDAGFGCPPGCISGFQVARTPLEQLRAGGTISIDYTNPSDGPMAWGSHLMQNTENEIFWAGHNDSSHIRIFSLAEGSTTYFWRDVEISSWPMAGLSSTTPDGQDWLTKLSGFPGNGVIGAARVSNQLWFAWSAGTDNNFQQPHVEMVTLDRNDNFNVMQRVQIWNNGYAFAYPALARNSCTGEIGLSLEYGGNGNYENHVVGLWGDFLVYITSSSNIGTTRFGDYVTIRQAPASEANPGNLFSAFGYGLSTTPPPGPGTQTDIRYVLFGRPASSCNIIR